MFEFKDLTLGKKIYNMFDAKEYEVIKVENDEEELPPYTVYVAHLDGDGSEVKCIYTSPQLYQWCNTYKEVMEDKAKKAKADAIFLENLVKEL